MSISYEEIEMQNRMLCGEFGMEKESLRTDEKGEISLKPHLHIDEKHVQRDFAESQVELITGVSYSASELYHEIGNLQKKVAQALYHRESGTEYLWPFSNPPYISDCSQIDVAKFEKEDLKKQEYREYLAEKYGKSKMLLSGIHINFSFPEATLKLAYQKSADKEEKSYREYKNEVYLELAKKLTKYSWLIVYLTAASPVMDGSF